MNPAWSSRHRRSLSDGGAVLLAAATAGAAWAAFPVPRVLGLVGITLAVLVRRPALLVVASMAFAGGSAAHATAGLRIDEGTVRESVEVVRVSIDATGTAHPEVRAGAHHLFLEATSSGQALLEGARPGDRFLVGGRVTPADPVAQRARGRHVAGTLHAVWIRRGRAPQWPWRVADRVHDAVQRLGRPLPSTERALFNGFVLGDASGQDAVQRADFLGSGLTHLLVASGENVAFLLTLAGPLLRRSRLGVRWAISVLLLVGFGFVTGFEPSVLRAAVMAGIAVTAAGLGRPVASWRTLALAVTALLWVDPFLVHSVAFGLSVGASAGIVGLARPLAALLAGPEPVVQVVAVTTAAQVGVAPLLVGFTGGLPVATLPANALAAGPAGLVVVLGLPCLLVAATGIPGTALLVWAPRLLLGWIGGVARAASTWPLGRLGPDGVIGGCVLVGATVGAHRLGLRRVCRSCGAAALAVCCTPAVVMAVSPPSGDPSNGVHVIRRGATTVLVLTASPPPVELLDDVAALGVTRADVVVIPHGDADDRAALSVLARRSRVGRVVSPRPLPGARFPVDVPAPGERRRYGGAVLDVVLVRPVLSVRVEPEGPP